MYSSIKYVPTSVVSKGSRMKFKPWINLSQIQTFIKKTPISPKLANLAQFTVEIGIFCPSGGQNLNKLVNIL